MGSTGPPRSGAFKKEKEKEKDQISDMPALEAPESPRFNDSNEETDDDREEGKAPVLLSLKAPDSPRFAGRVGRNPHKKHKKKKKRKKKELRRRSLSYDLPKKPTIWDS